jgi:hypothetical protein
MEYNLHTRNQIPKDYECCYNCEFMSWMVAIGQGARCGNEKNRYRVFRPEGKKLKLPVIPGVAKKCEHFSNIRRRMTLRVDMGDNRTMPLRHDVDVDKILEEIKVVGEDWKTDGICQIMIQGAEGKEDDVYFGSREFKEIEEAGYNEWDFNIALFPEMIYTNNLLKELKMYRSRLMLLKPKSCLSWHHDPSMRIHIPLCGDSDSFHLMENIEGKKEVYHIYPGEVHLMNTEVYHSGINLSRKVDRIHIVGCVNVDDENN